MARIFCTYEKATGKLVRFFTAISKAVIIG